MFKIEARRFLMDTEGNFSIFRNQSDFADEGITFSEDMWLLSFYSIVSLSGIIGNILVISVIILNRNIHGTPFGIYAGALAIADMLAAMTAVPLYILSTGTVNGHPVDINGKVMCRIITGYSVIFYFGIVSVYTLLAITLERYHAICNPQSTLAVRTTSRAKKVIIIIWFLSFAIRVNAMIGEEYGTSTDPYIGAYCKFSIPHRSKLTTQVFYGFIFAVQYVTPLSLVTFCLVKICQKYAQINTIYLDSEVFRRQNADIQSNIDLLKEIKKALIVMSVLRFGLCAPNRILYFCFSIGSRKMKENALDTNLVQVSVFLYFTICCVNPVIYAIWDQSFRQGYISILKCNFQSYPCPSREYVSIPDSLHETTV